MPLPNLLLAAFIMGAVGTAAQALNAHTGFPFGRIEFSSNLGPRWFGGPLCLILVGPLMLLSARGTAQWILRPRLDSPNYGYRLLALTVALATLLQASFDFFATNVSHWWRWQETAWTWEGLALHNLAGWVLVGTAAMLLATPALINKSPIRPEPAPLPLLMWVLLNLVLLAAALARGASAGPAILTAAAAITSVLAVRNGRSLRNS